MERKMKKEKKIEFAVPEEDTQYVKEIRVYNVKIPLSSLLREVSPIIKKELVEKIEEKFNKEEYQIILIPHGYFDEVIVRFGEGVRRQEKVLHRGQFLNFEDILDLLKEK